MITSKVSSCLLITLAILIFQSSPSHGYIDHSLFRGYPIALKHNLLTEVGEWFDFTRNIRDNGLTITLSNIRLPRLSLSNLQVPLLPRLPRITINFTLR